MAIVWGKPGSSSKTGSGTTPRLRTSRSAPASQPAQDVPVKSTLLTDLIQRFKETYLGTTNWFSPGQPNAPINPESMPRQKQIPVGYNLIYTPRSTSATPFSQLLFFATSYDIAGICLNRRIEQMQGLKWDIVSRDDVNGKKYVDQIKEIKQFFRRPDQQNDWQTWLRLVLWDRLVYDAVTIYPRPTRGGDLYGLETIDGSTVKVLADYRGKLPDAPAPAYQQVLWGVARGMWSTDELIYKPQNVKNSDPYGMSEIETILVIVNMALRKRMKDLAYFTDGNIPHSLVAMPEEWQPDQIDQWQEQFDARMAGNLPKSSRITFIPSTGRGGQVPVHEFAPFLGDPTFDTWLLKITCAAMHVTPSEIGFTDDVNKATATSQENVTYRDAINPLAMFVKLLVDYIIEKYFGQPDLEFIWDYGEVEDKLKEAQVDQIYMQMPGVISSDEIRENKLNLDPYGIEPWTLVSGQPMSIKNLKTMLAQPWQPPQVGPDGKPLPPGAQIAGAGPGDKPGMNKPGGNPDDENSVGDKADAGNVGDSGTVTGDSSGGDADPGTANPGDLGKSFNFTECCGWTPDVSFAKSDSATGPEYDSVDIDWHQTLTDAKKSPELGEPRAGALDAVQRFLDAGLKVYLSCGGLSDPEHGEELATRMRTWLLQHGIDPSQGIILRPKPRTLAVVDDRAICPGDANWSVIADEVFRRKDKQDAALAARATQKTVSSPDFQKSRAASYQAARDDLRRWRGIARKSALQTRPIKPFTSDVIPEIIQKFVAEGFDHLAHISGPEQRADHVTQVIDTAINLLTQSESTSISAHEPPGTS